MTKRETEKFQLSRSILDMKFMKRTKEKVDEENYQAEGEEYFDNLLTTKMKKESGKYIVENSFVFCEQLIEGRLSYQGMNPEIERILELEENAKRNKEELSNEKEITDAQMANHYHRGGSHVHTMAKKFAQKRNQHKYFKYNDDNDNSPEPVNKKPKYLKPKD